MNLIILENQDQADGGKYVIEDFRLDHVRDILRASTGKTLEVGLVNGPFGTATVESIDKGRAVLNCVFEDSSRFEVESPIDIICALPRPQTLKKVLHSAAAMGVRNIYFIRSNRVEKSYFDSPLLAENKYRKYLIEGLSQGKCTAIPKVSFHDRFKPFFQDALPTIITTETRKLLFDLEADRNLLQAEIKPDQPVILALGPEGGWVPFEVELMKDLAFEPTTLGSWTLRVENALVAALAQLAIAVR